MLYSVAVVVIAVIVGVLYFFGFFTAAAYSENACVPLAGYLCTSPTLSSNGLLKVTIGQGTTTPIEINYIGCSNTTTAPSFPTQFIAFPAYVVQGSVVNASFLCPLPSSAALGTSFTGTLWINYSQGTQSGLVSQVASVKAVVESLGSSQCCKGIIAWVPITIRNQQPLATQSNFQQQLNVTSSSYSAYIQRQWNNVEFTYGSPTGTQLQAWIESGPSNTASLTTVWVNLGTSIPGSSNAIIYMDFMDSNVMSASGPTGEAPQLSSAYGQYDNGAKVFNFYDNFYGNKLNTSHWTYDQGPDASMDVAVNNGLTLERPSGQTITSCDENANPCINLGITTDGVVSAFSATTTFEFYGYPIFPNSVGYSSSAFGYSSNSFRCTQGAVAMDGGLSGASTLQIPGSAGTCVESTLSSSQSTGVWSIVRWQENMTSYFNYQEAGSAQSPSASSSPVTFWYQALATGTGTVTWLRVRQTPPYGLMPAYSFGSLVKSQLP